jgi:hypothetical protein
VDLGKALFLSFVTLMVADLIEAIDKWLSGG